MIVENNKEVKVRALRLIANDTTQLIGEWNRIMRLCDGKNGGGRSKEQEEALQEIRKAIKQNEDVVELIKEFAFLKIQDYGD